MEPIQIAHALVGVLLAIAALLVMYRIVRGPTILDRMIASDVMLTTVILVLSTEMALNQHTRTLPVVLVLAGTAVFGSIAVARYVSKQDKVPGFDGATATSAGAVDQAIEPDLGSPEDPDPHTDSTGGDDARR